MCTKFIWKYFSFGKWAIFVTQAALSLLTILIGKNKTAPYLLPQHIILHKNIWFITPQHNYSAAFISYTILFTLKRKRKQCTCCAETFFSYSHRTINITSLAFVVPWKQKNPDFPLSICHYYSAQTAGWQVSCFNLNKIFRAEIHDC